jgi:hypothetical protein
MENPSSLLYQRAQNPLQVRSNLKRYFGDVPIVEMYTATEGVFGQRLDDLPYITPTMILTSSKLPPARA